MNISNLLPTVSVAHSGTDTGYDAVVACGVACVDNLPQYKQVITDAVSIDQHVEDVRLLPCSAAPGRRLVFVDTGLLLSVFIK